MNLPISVIIPVYNAESTLRRAVESTVDLPEVGEVVLVDDAGPDGSLEICQELETEFSLVRLVRHPDLGNHGAGASRNLGIETATSPLIAFLDADDEYFPKRFRKDKEILEADPSVDGVYNAVTTGFVDEEARRQFFEKGFGDQEKLTLSAPIPPEELFFAMFSQHPTVSGGFCTDGITVRRKLLDRIGPFDTTLRLQQDTHLWSRMAAYGKLMPGEIQSPVARRWIHHANRMTDLEAQSRYESLWWDSLHREFRRRGLPRENWIAFAKAYAWWASGNATPPKATRAIAGMTRRSPRLFLERDGLFDVLIARASGNHRLGQRVLSAKNRLLRTVGLQDSLSPVEEESRSTSTDRNSTSPDSSPPLR